LNREYVVAGLQDYNGEGYDDDVANNNSNNNNNNYYYYNLVTFISRF